MRRLFLLVLGLTACLGAAPSWAAVTESAITTPSAPFFAVDDQDVEQGIFTIAGTTNGVAGDEVDLRCTRDGSGAPYTLVSNLSLGAGGSFSVDVDLDETNTNGEPCFLRATPSGGGGFVANFEGPVLGIGTLNRNRVSGGPNDGLLIGVRADLPGLTGFADLDSDRGIDDLTYTGVGLDDETDALDEVRIPDEPQTLPGRSGIRVDAFNAYTPENAINLFAGSSDLAGIPALTTTSSVDAATGLGTLTTTEPLVRCSSETFPADAGSCTAFTSVGVALERVMRTGGGGRSAEVVTRFVSTDGAAHTADVFYLSDHQDSEMGWLVPGGPGFYDRYTGVRLRSAQLPGEPFRIFGHESDDEPLGSLEDGLLGVSFDQRPTSITWPGDDRFEARYAVSVPAGGAGSVRFAATVGTTEGDVRGAAATLDDAWSAPTVSIASPTGDQVLSPGVVRVTGTARDASVTPAVTINGTPARVDADGVWSVDLPAPAGTLALTAVARDTAGQTATATRSAQVVAGQGPAGPPGARGPEGARLPKLVLTIASKSLRARRGRPVSVRVQTNGPALLTTRIRRGPRTVRTVERAARRTGTTTIPLGRYTRTGTYTVRVSGIGADGSTATRTLTLRVVR